MSFRYAAGPDEVWHDDARGTIFDELAELPTGQEPFRNAHRRFCGGLQTCQGIWIQERHQVFLPHHFVRFHGLGDADGDGEIPFAVTVVRNLHVHANGVADIPDRFQRHVEFIGRQELSIGCLGETDGWSTLHGSDAFVKEPLGLLAGSVELQGGGVDADLSSDCTAEKFVNRYAEGLSLDVPECDVERGNRAHLGSAVAGVIGESEHRLPVALDGERVATDKQRAEVVVYRRLNDRGGVEGFAEADDPFVGVDLDPKVMGLLGDTDGFDLGDFHGVVLNFFVEPGRGFGANIAVRAMRIGYSVEALKSCENQHHHPCI